MKKKDDDVLDEDEGTDVSRSLSDDKTGATDISQLDVDEESDDEADDEQVEVSGNKSLLFKLKDKINQLTRKGKKEASAAADEGGEAESDEAAALKKKKSLIIKGLIGAALIALILHESPEENAPVEVAQVPDSPARRAKKAAEANKAQPAEPAEAKTVEETPATETPATETPVAEPPSTDTPVETANTEAAPDYPVIDEPTTPEAPVAEAPDTEPQEPVIEPAIEAPSAETAATPTEEIQLDLEPAAPVGAETSTDSVDGTITQSGGDENLTDKILQDLEKEAKKSEVKPEKKDYVAPPDYEYVGRGLVYNCTGKHWACVDGPSYRICEENAASTKTLKKPAECYPFNVYQNQKGCENVQNRMVSSSAKTAFCNE